MELSTHCDRCGKEIKVVKETQDGGTFYMVHGLFCINVPAFFCEKECFEETLASIKSFDYMEKDDDGKAVVDVDVMINESLILDKMYDIVYDSDNPLFPTLIFQRLLEVDPGNVRFLYALSSLYVGLIAAENTPDEMREKMKERLQEVEQSLKERSEAGYGRLLEVKKHYGIDT